MSIEKQSEDIGSTIIKAGADALSEVAKAEQEQQRTMQSGLDLVRRAGRFLGGVFGPASVELGHLFGDQMKFWRFKNAVNILEKAQAIVDERGLKPEQIESLGLARGCFSWKRLQWKKKRAFKICGRV
jgi:phage FluMu protein gp41